MIVTARNVWRVSVAACDAVAVNAFNVTRTAASDTDCACVVASVRRGCLGSVAADV